MRAPILYLANRRMDFRMLLTPNRFLDFVMLLFLPFPQIPQVVAQFWSICPILCPISNPSHLWHILRYLYFLIQGHTSDLRGKMLESQSRLDNLLEKQRAEDERESRNTQTELSSRCQETKDFGSAFGDQFRQAHYTHSQDCLKPVVIQKLQYWKRVYLLITHCCFLTGHSVTPHTHLWLRLWRRTFLAVEPRPVATVNTHAVSLKAHQMTSGWRDTGPSETHLPTHPQSST